MEAWANQYRGQHHLHSERQTENDWEITRGKYFKILDKCTSHGPAAWSAWRVARCHVLHACKRFFESASVPLVDSVSADGKCRHYAHVERQVGERLERVLLPALLGDGGAQVGLRLKYCCGYAAWQVRRPPNTRRQRMLPRRARIENIHSPARTAGRRSGRKSHPEHGKGQVAFWV